MDVQNLKKAVAEYNRKVCGGPPSLIIGGGALGTAAVGIVGVVLLLGAAGAEWPAGNGGQVADPGMALVMAGIGIIFLTVARGTGKRITRLANQVINVDGGREDESHQKGTKILNVGGAGYRLPAPDGALRIAGIPLPAGVEQQHILLAGAPGSGKSEALKALVAIVRERGSDGAVIHDPTGEMVALFYDPSKDWIINPLDARHANWDLWADMRPGEEANLAKAVIPSAQGDNKYFSYAAQALL